MVYLQGEGMMLEVSKPLFNNYFFFFLLIRNCSDVLALNFVVVVTFQFFDKHKRIHRNFLSNPPPHLPTIQRKKNELFCPTPLIINTGAILEKRGTFLKFLFK